MSWGSYVPSVCNPDLGPLGMSFVVRVKALHHWLRKGNANKAERAARVAFRQAGKILQGRL